MESSPVPGSTPAPELESARDTPNESPNKVGDAAPSELRSTIQDEQPNEDTPVAGPSTPTPAPAPAPRKQYRRPKPKADRTTAYTTAWVPGLYNIKNPAGDYLQRDSNVDVVRQVSLARARREKEAAAATATNGDAEADGAGEAAENGDAPDIAKEVVNPLSQILIIHPGSRNLRIGRASDFYPVEVPNCIARPAKAPGRGSDPPVPGSRVKRLAADHLERKEAKKRRKENGEDLNGDPDLNEKWVDPVDESIGFAREYLREKLRANRLSTDYREGNRVKASNGRVKPEPIPEHNDPYRIEWTEVDGKTFFVGDEALKLPDGSGFKIRWPILRRSLNLRDWSNKQLLLDDIGTIIEETLKKELDIHAKDYHKYSVVFLVPDHGDRFYVQEMTHLFLSVMGFKEIAVHQEAYAAIFAAGMSTACVVDIGAERTSVTCVDEGNLVSDTRISLDYGGDDITLSLVQLLQRASFPYRDLDLARTQDRIMMDNLKIKICTLEEHLVANTPWDFYVLKTEGLTDKYVFRTYDENIVAPLCFFDTRMVDFEEKDGSPPALKWNDSDEVDDLLASSYGEPTGAMRSCTSHLRPAAAQVSEVVAAASAVGTPDKNAANGSSTPKVGSPVKAGSPTKIDGDKDQNQPGGSDKPKGEDKPDVTEEGGSTPRPAAAGDSNPQAASQSQQEKEEAKEVVEPAIEYDIVKEASKVPLDGAIAASIALAGATENKIKAAASSILLIGGSSALKGIGAFIADRLPSLLRARQLPIQDVSIVPPPRNLNPRFVSWKGACVMCNLESLSDMWIRRDEWEAIGARALKDRYLFI